MAAASKINEQLSTLFTKQPCWMIEPLAAELKYSIPSVRRFLTAVGYYSSFNRDGLWFHHEIGFSRTGSLTKTLIALSVNSPAGVTAEQLGEKLHCRRFTVVINDNLPTSLVIRTLYPTTIICAAAVSSLANK